ncbi:hypothetical protein CEXT_210871, partial [Caerostris extrusa]
NDNLSKKKEYILEWVSRFGICPIAECKIHNANLKSNQLKITTKHATSEISSRNDKASSSKDFKKPNRKHTAKANFISGNAENVKTITENKYATLSTAVTDESESTVIVVVTAKATEKRNPFRIPVNNKFKHRRKTTSYAQAKETDDYSPTKPPPIMLALTANYTHVSIFKKYIKNSHLLTEKKLTKGYIKIFPDSVDSYREKNNIPN